MTALPSVKSLIFLFEVATLEQMPLHREIANKTRTKEIMRKPSIQQVNKAIAKPPTALTTTAWQVTRQASKGHWREALLLDSAQGDPSHSEAAARGGSDYPPFPNKPSYPQGIDTARGIIKRLLIHPLLGLVLRKPRVNLVLFSLNEGKQG